MAHGGGASSPGGRGGPKTLYYTPRHCNVASCVLHVYPVPGERGPMALEREREVLAKLKHTHIHSEPVPR